MLTNSLLSKLLRNLTHRSIHWPWGVLIWVGERNPSCQLLVFVLHLILLELPMLVNLVTPSSLYLSGFTWMRWGHSSYVLRTSLRQHGSWLWWNLSQDFLVYYRWSIHRGNGIVGAPNRSGRSRYSSKPVFLLIAICRYYVFRNFASILRAFVRAPRLLWLISLPVDAGVWVENNWRILLLVHSYRVR